MTEYTKKYLKDLFDSLFFPIQMIAATLVFALFFATVASVLTFLKWLGFE